MASGHYTGRKCGSAMSIGIHDDDDIFIYGARWEPTQVAMDGIRHLHYIRVIIILSKFIVP